MDLVVAKKVGWRATTAHFRLLRRRLAQCTAVFLFFWVALWWLLSRFTDSSVPLADGFAAAAAYTGMWLMARKKLENWIWWIVTNIASIPLYFSKGFVFTSFQYLVFLVLAIMGYVEWRRKLAQSAAAKSA